LVAPEGSKRGWQVAGQEGLEFMARGKIKLKGMETRPATRDKRVILKKIPKLRKIKGK